jgi:pimeloyl-ACP methyl ester carboxylesterase
VRSSVRILVLVFMCSPAALKAQQTCANGGCQRQPTVPSFRSNLAQLAPAASPAPSDNLTQFKTYTVNGDYVVAGVGVRGTGTGTINVSGIPSGVQIVAAYLYWETLGNGQVGNFGGRAISGIPLGTVTSPCWLPPLITVYRVDATSYISSTGNCAYQVSFPDSHDFSVAPSTEGASLLIVYQRSDLPRKTIVIYDGAYTQTSGTPSFNLTLRGFMSASTGAPQAKLTHIVGDGQSFSKTLTIDGVVFGAPLNPFPGAQGQLWDNPTYDVSSLIAPGAASVTTSVQWPNMPGTPNDCLTWGAVAFSTVIDGGNGVDLLDPVSELLSGPDVIAPNNATNISVLAAKGTPRQGIAADGVAKLVVRINAASAGTASVTMTDENGVPVPQSSAQYGTLTDLFGQPLAGPVSTTPTSQGNKVWALYTAPKAFVRNNSDSSLSQRAVMLKVHFTPTSGSPQDLPPVAVAIVRPPVVLVHGLWSNEAAWSNFPLASSRDCTDSGQYYTCRIDYQNDNAAKFAVIALSVGHQIRDFITKFKTAKSVAAVQATVIGHSMGGLVPRVLPLCGTTFQDCLFQYRTSVNFNLGDVNRLITIGSPHQGSPLANDLWTNQSTLCVFGLWGNLAGNFAAKGLPIGGAVEDLQTNSGAISGLNGSTAPYPMTFFVGEASRSDETLFNSGLIDTIRSCNSNIVPADIRTVFGEDSDLVVSVTSQRYGLGDGATGTQTYTFTIHSSALTHGESGFSPDELDLGTLGADAVRAIDEGAFISK